MGSGFQVVAFYYFSYRFINLEPGCRVFFE